MMLSQPNCIENGQSQVEESMPNAPYGNDPQKIRRYQAFWNRDAVERPLVGFSLAGWFPLGDFEACRLWQSQRYVSPEMIDPAEFLPDHLRLLREGEIIEDDILRGACPGQVALPWLPGIIGCRMRILPGNILGEEQNLPWDQTLQVELRRSSPWYSKYMDFVAALVSESDGRFPVSHAADIGPTDMHAVLRGHTQSIMDLIDEPEKSGELLWKLGAIFRDITDDVWKRIPRFHNGYFDAQYSLWSPGPIARLQEDATAVYSPGLYRKLVQPVDRMVAAHFASSFIHLHSTSMFLLEAFLEIEEIKCFQVNNDASGPPVKDMVAYFQMIQQAGRPLLIRGSFTPKEMRLLMDWLEARGLFLLIMVKDLAEVDALRPIVGM
jgi:hypothetical protein